MRPLAQAPVAWGLLNVLPAIMCRDAEPRPKRRTEFIRPFPFQSLLLSSYLSKFFRFPGSIVYLPMLSSQSAAFRWFLFDLLSSSVSSRRWLAPHVQHQASSTIPLDLFKCYALLFPIPRLLCFCCVLCYRILSITLPTCCPAILLSAHRVRRV